MPSAAYQQKMDAARPTAVNLHWALTQVMTTANHMTAAACLGKTKILEKQAIAMQHEDVAIIPHYPLMGRRIIEIYE